MAREDVTRILHDMKTGAEDAPRVLLSLLYDELRLLAGHLMRGQPADHTLQATALVNEAYLKLMKRDDRTWENRSHFLRVAAKAMRCVLIDHARARLAGKRGGGWRVAPLEEAAVFTDRPSRDLLSLDDALEELAGLDPRMAQVVELRFFGGLGVEETARVMDISTATVKREWMTAKAWLRDNVLRRRNDGS